MDTVGSQRMSGTDRASINGFLRPSLEQLIAQARKLQPKITY